MSLLSYQIIGKGKPLVLLHGFLEDKNMWNFLQFTDEDEVQYIMIDLPGHGNSNNYSAIHSMDFMAKKVKEILEHENLKNAHFIGHSMGGYVAMAFLDQFPEMVQSLGLFFSSPFEDDENKKEMRLRALELAITNKDDFIRLGIPSLFNQKRIKNLKEEIKKAKKMASQTTLEGVIAAILGMRDRKELSHLLKNIKIPIFWIYGEYDNAVAYQKIEEFTLHKKYIQDFRLPIGHMGHLEAPDICNTIIHQFINEI